MDKKIPSVCYILLRKTILKTRSYKSFFLLIVLLGCLLNVVYFLKLQFKVAEKVSYGQVFVHDFESMKDRNYLRQLVRPEQKTATIVPRNISAYDERKLVACFVLSSPGNVHKRKAIRLTWGELAKPIFLIALGDIVSTMRTVSREAETFDDIIVEDFVDSHDNLTLKTAFALKNFLNHFSNSKYFLKIDDDMYLNVTRLYEMLEQAPINSLIGRLNPHAKPIRDVNSKFYVPEFLYEKDEFPIYLEGPAYVIPGQIVKSVYDEAMETPFLNIEDIFYTGIVARQKLNFKLHHDPRFRVLPFPHNFPCLYEDYIVVHEVSPTNLINLWERFKMKKTCNLIEQLKAKWFREVEWFQASNQSRMLSLH